MIDMECNEFLVFGRRAEEQIEVSPGLRSSILNHKQEKSFKALQSLHLKKRKVTDRQFIFFSPECLSDYSIIQ